MTEEALALAEAVAKLIAVLIVLPSLYGIGLFYWRLTCLSRAISRMTPSVAIAIAEMSEDSRYETALATARAITRQYATRPDMAPHERLASVTYAVLEAIYLLEGLRQSGTACPEPSVN